MRNEERTIHIAQGKHEITGLSLTSVNSSSIKESKKKSKQVSIFNQSIKKYTFRPRVQNEVASVLYLSDKLIIYLNRRSQSVIYDK